MSVDRVQDRGMPDFDFAIGTWNVVNRALTSAFNGSTDWISYPSTVTCWSIFDGNGTLDEVIFPTKGTRGMTLRLFDLERKEWWIYWADSRTGQLGPPVMGTFTDGRGDFYGDDTLDGKPSGALRLVRHHPDVRPLEQEFSADGGRTWSPTGSWSSPAPDAGPAGGQVEDGRPRRRWSRCCRGNTNSPRSTVCPWLTGPRLVNDLGSFSCFARPGHLGRGRGSAR